MGKFIVSIMSNIFRSIYLTLFINMIFLGAAHAQGAIAALDTNGAVLQVDTATGTLSVKATAELDGYVLGGTARRAGKFYFVAQPDNSSQNALFSVVLSSGASSQVALDRNDDVRALFFVGKKLFGVFYNGNEGSAGVYRINLTTGITTQVLDLSALDIEPIAGAFAKLNEFYYMLAKPESDSGQRRLLKFKPKAGSAKLFDVVDGSAAPVLCNKLKPNLAKNNFVCLAEANSETQVNVCKLSQKGKATVLSTLPEVRRVGSGHTMLTRNGLVYYAFVYHPEEENNQRLIKFTAKGVVKSNTPINGIAIGAHFQSEQLQ